MKKMERKRKRENKDRESGIVPEDWRSAVIVPMYKGKGED